MDSFAHTLIDWQKNFGRHGLAWQVKDPYARWISEVMLQQTQVATVKDYYARFMERFPTVEELASASEDEVMSYWAGLGYYSRARNLRCAALKIMTVFGGEFPKTRQQWESLPGVGRSTAAAITAFSFNAREAILDGNVKRVLARHFAIDEVIEGRVLKDMWALAQSLLPEGDMTAYTQGLMDLGATVCVKNPKCVICPFKDSCLAHARGCELDLPKKKQKRVRPEKTRTMLLFWVDDAVYLVKRQQKGVWQGLFSLPEVEGEVPIDVLEAQWQEKGVVLKNVRALDVLVHDFSHYRLHIRPVAIALRKTEPIPNENGRWVRATELSTLGLPAPIEVVIKNFFAF